MAHDEKDPETRDSGVADPTDAHRAAGTLTSDEATPAPTDAAASPPAVAPAGRRKNRLVLTFAAATLGLLATAGAIGAYRFRDKHEKLAAFAAMVDEFSARPEKLVASLREQSLKLLGDAAKPTKKPIAPEPPPPAKLEARTEPPVEAKPALQSPSGDRITWSAPPAPPKATPPSPAPEAKPEARTEPKTAPPVALARPPEPPPAKAPEVTPPEVMPAIDSDARAEIETLSKRVEELERIARSALRLAEQAQTQALARAGAPAAAPSAELRDLSDNVTGLDGRIDELGDELKAIRERLDSPKDESRLPREVAVEEQTAPEGPDPAAVAVIAHSLQKSLDRGKPYASEIAALAAQGVDKEALAALAPTADSGAPTAHALRAAFHPLVKTMEASAEHHAEESLSDRLLHGASKLVKMRGPGEATKIEVAEIGAKIEAALDRDDIAVALASFDELPEPAKTVARDWEEMARRRLEADRAAASILSGALEALGKPKGKS
jgi:hypothetical protein